MNPDSYREQLITENMQGIFTTSLKLIRRHNLSRYLREAQYNNPKVLYSLLDRTTKQNGVNTRQGNTIGYEMEFSPFSFKFKKLPKLKNYS